MYTIDSVAQQRTSLFWTRLIQPHACLVMHEKLQRVELSVFDMNVKRTTPSSATTSLIPLPFIGAAAASRGTVHQLPDEREFLRPMVETRAGESNPKTGMSSAFFSFKVSNFAHLFRRGPAATAASYATPTIIEQHLHHQQQQQHPPSSVIACTCTTCHRCYEFSNASNATTAAATSAADKKNNTLLFKTTTMTTALTTTKTMDADVCLGRPVRVKCDPIVFDYINAFVKSVAAFGSRQPPASTTTTTTTASTTPSNSTPSRPSRVEHKPTATTTTTAANGDSNSIVQLFFNVNTHVSVNQLVVQLEIEAPSSDISSSSSNNSVQISLGKLEAHSGKLPHELYSPSERAYTLGHKNYASLVLDDLRCQMLDTGTGTDKVAAHRHYIDIIGPLSLNSFAAHSPGDNELHAQIGLGSFSVCVNRRVLELVSNVSAMFATDDSTTAAAAAAAAATAVASSNQPEQQFTDEDAPDEASEGGENKCPSDGELFAASLISHQDDLRQNRFKYTIVDDSYVKSMNKQQQHQQHHHHLHQTWLVAHVRLPHVNEIVCVDDMSVPAVAGYCPFSQSVHPS